MFQKNPSLTRLLIYPAVFAVLIISSSCSKESAVEKTPPTLTSYAYRPPTPEPTPVDARAGEFQVQLLDGGSAKFSELIGNNKVVILNFWATWCGPCRKEIPELTALQRQYRDKGLVVVGLTVEEPDKESLVREFVFKNSINYKIGFARQELFFMFNGADPRGPIPQTFIFDKNGKLIDKAKGYRRDFRNWAEGAVAHALSNS